MRSILLAAIALFMVVFPAFAHHTLDLSTSGRTQDVKTTGSRHKHVDDPSYESGPPHWSRDDSGDARHSEDKRSSEDVPESNPVAHHTEPKRFTPLNYREPQDTEPPTDPVIPKPFHYRIATSVKEGDSSRSVVFIPPQNVQTTPSKMRPSNRKPTFTTDVAGDVGPSAVPA